MPRDLHYDEACQILQMAIIIKIAKETGEGISQALAQGVALELAEVHGFPEEDIRKFFEAGYRQILRVDDAIDFIKLSNMPVDGVKTQ